MRIAVCDRDDETRHQIRQLLSTKANFASLGRQSLVCYQNVQQLLSDYKSKIAYDLLWLSVDNQGLKVAEEIRRLDKEVLIIVIADDAEQIIQAFHINAFVYLQKPLRAAEAEEEFRRAVETYRLRHFCCRFTTNRQQLHISIEQIAFLECKGRSLDIYTMDHHRINVPGKMKEAEEALRSWGFIRTHKSFLVNVAYIEAIGQRDVQLSLRYKEQPILVDVSERRRAQLRQVFLLYQAGQLVLTRQALPVSDQEDGIFRDEECPL